MKKTIIFIILFLVLANLPVNFAFASDAPELSITYPSAGEKLSAGQTYEISWTQKNVDAVTLALMKKNTSGDYTYYRPIVSLYQVDIQKDTNFYSWNIPNDSALLMDDCLIRIIAYHTNYGSIIVDSQHFSITKEPKGLSDLIITDVKIGAVIAPVMRSEIFLQSEGPVYETEGVGFIITVKNQGVVESSYLLNNYANYKLDVRMADFKNVQSGSFINISENDTCRDETTDVKPGESVTIRCSFFYSTRDLAVGHYRINLTVDPKNIILESNEPNNGLTYEFEIKSKNNINVNNQNQNINQNEQLHKQSLNYTFAKKLKGRLLLQVEQGGAIWYVNPINLQKYQVTWANAVALFTNFALGITDVDLLKIPADINSINPNLDTDGDGYGDRLELNNGHSPYLSGAGKGRFSTDKNFSEKFKGRLLLQVEQGGAIWYVDLNGTRHNVRWDNLMDIFTGLALGITNDDLNKIPIGN